MPRRTCGLILVASVLVVGCGKSAQEIEQDRGSVLKSLCDDVVDALRKKDLNAVRDAADLALLNPGLIAVHVNQGDGNVLVRPPAASRDLFTRISKQLSDGARAKKRPSKKNGDSSSEKWLLERKAPIAWGHPQEGQLSLFWVRMPDAMDQVSRERATTRVRRGETVNIDFEVGLVLGGNKARQYLPLKEELVGALTRDHAWVTSRGVTMAGVTPTVTVGTVRYGDGRFSNGIDFSAEGAFIRMRGTATIAADCPPGIRWVALSLPALAEISKATGTHPELRYRRDTYGLEAARCLRDGLGILAARLNVAPPE